MGDDVDRARDNTDAAMAEDPVAYMKWAAEEGAQALMVLAKANDGELVIPEAGMEAACESGECLHVSRRDGNIILRVVTDPPAAKVQAVLEASPDWITTATGRAVKVTGGEGDLVIYVEELSPGRWSPPNRLDADAFLRYHVLAAGVPLLG